MADCIFCDILAGSAPASFVHRDELCAAFMDIQPVNPGHLLVVPVAQRLAAALRQSGVRCEGVDLFLADGEAAGQEVFHVHLHVIPRFTGDGFGFRFGPEYHNLPPRTDLDQVAAQIMERLGASPRPITDGS